MTSTEIIALETDGEGDASIDCSVTGNGPFLVVASVAGGSTQLTIDIAAFDPSATAQQPTDGTVGYRSDETVQTFNSPVGAPCHFWFGQYQHAARGRAWFQFECPEIANESAAQSCALGESTVVMQNCKM